MPYSPKAQLDPDLKTFRDLVASGVKPTDAYKRVYAASRTITPQALYQGGLRMLNRINRLNVKQVCLKPVDKPIIKPVFKDKAQPVADKDFESPRKLLLKRLWEAVNSQANPEAIAAVKQLREWLREDEQDSKASQVADPAIIARHCASIAGEYAAMEPAVQLQYMTRILDVLESCGLPKAHMLQVLQPVPEIPIINDLQQEPVAITRAIIDNKPINNALQQSN